MDWNNCFKPSKSKIFLTAVLFVVLFWLLTSSLITYVEPHEGQELLSTISLILNAPVFIFIKILESFNLLDIIWIALPVGFIAEVSWCYFLACVIVAIKQNIISK
jgi:hypothetical protein